MKRKAEENTGDNGSKKRPMQDDFRNNFRSGLFDGLQKYRSEYANSIPYKHGVIHNLVDDNLLRRVRSEILENLHFTEKETDIYRIHQTGDLANLDGLDEKSLSKLPSILALRNALYSSQFRAFISEVANSGPVSGKKTDMSINMYTPGCHLLCHDDVIGSRRLSYILYLTDPDLEWKPEWGGALRLYPTEKVVDKMGTEAMVPSPEFSVSIPPAWNQLSFFTIQPGQSFHDVEEVYWRAQKEDTNDGGRIRIAISGWFHIPQEGEDGYEEGLEEKLAERSSLTQLQSNVDQFDLPQSVWRESGRVESHIDGTMWTENELEFLAKFINPSNLIPETLTKVRRKFRKQSLVVFDNFLTPKFAKSLYNYMSALDENREAKMPTRKDIPLEKTGIARPPYKHRFLYRNCHGLHLNQMPMPETSPFDQLLDTLLPSPLFSRWLEYFTTLKFSRSSYMARRFRRGSDYALATGYDGNPQQLELILGLTPTEGWESEHTIIDKAKNGASSSKSVNSKAVDGKRDVGGVEIYMAMDEDETEDAENAREESRTGAEHRRKADPAVYEANAGGSDVVHTMPPCWNSLSIVLRDEGLLRFVKYVSKSAPGDRWDIVGSCSVVNDDDDDEEQTSSGEDISDDLEDMEEDDDDEEDEN